MQATRWPATAKPTCGWAYGSAPFALLPLGVFFTFKAVGDSAVFNIDAYKAFFRHIAGREEKRSLSVKEVRMNTVDAAVAWSFSMPSMPPPMP